MQTAPGSPAPKREVTHWRLALLLGVATGIGSVLVVPYALAMTGANPSTRSLPIGVAVLLSGVEGTVAGAVLAWIGLRLGASLGLDAPLLRAWIDRRPFASASHWVAAAIVGVVASLTIVAVDFALSRFLMSSDELERMRRIVAAHHAARWMGALASVSGGIGEEVQLRLFLMTTVAWCLAKVTRSKSVAVLTAANVIAALAFGAGHLPFAAKIFGTLSMGLGARIVLVNAVAGVMFGEMYRRYGLEHAMVAHFCADVVLHVVIGS